MSLEPAKIQDSLKSGDDFEIDFAAGQLRRSGRILKVERIPMDVLLFLVQHRRELVTTVGGALFSDNYPIFQFLEDWVFASDRLFGKMPIWANASLAKVLQPAARRAGITKKVGLHTFRHTYGSLLAESGDDVSVVQELMRHAKVNTTTELYTHARMHKKRAAQSRAVDLLFSRERGKGQP